MMCGVLGAWVAAAIADLYLASAELLKYKTGPSTNERDCPHAQI